MDLQGIYGETPDGKHGAVDGQRGNDGIDPGTVRQSGIHHGRGFVDTAPHGRHDFIDDPPQVGVVFETGFRLDQLPETFQVDIFVGIDQDIGNSRVLHERFQGAQTHDLVLDLFIQPIPFIHVQGIFCCSSSLKILSTSRRISSPNKC